MACIAKLGEGRGGVYRVSPSSQSIGGKQELCIRNRLKGKSEETSSLSPAQSQEDAFWCIAIRSTGSQISRGFSGFNSYA